MPAPSTGKPGTLLDLAKQSKQGNAERKVLQYAEGYQILEGDDLITKDYLFTEFGELMPEKPTSMAGVLPTIVSGYVLKSGYLAQAANASYDPAVQAGSQVSYLCRKVAGTLQTPNISTGIRYGDQGIFALEVNGVILDSISLGTLFDEALRDGNQVYPSTASGTSPLGRLDVVSIGKYNNWKKYQKAVISVNLQAADLRSGDNSVRLLHQNTQEGLLASATLKLWVDDSASNPSISAATLGIASTAIVHASGVAYYGQGTVANISAQAQALLDQSYVASPLSVSGDGISPAAVSLTDASVSGVSSPANATDQVSISAFNRTLSVADKASLDWKVSVTPSDPFGSYSAVQTSSIAALMSTFADKSTETYQHACDEKYRIPATWDFNSNTVPSANSWNRQTLLQNGQAQHKLLAANSWGVGYPVGNYSANVPANSANYSSFSGDQKWYRWVRHTGSGKSSIRLTLKGIASGIGQVGTGEVNVRVKLGNQTGWGDAARPYNGVGLPNDNDGCMNGAISYSGGDAVIDVTFGTKSSFGSNLICFIEVTFRNNTTKAFTELLTNW